MKNNLLNLVRWFCSKLTYNDLASVVPILQDILSGARKNIKLKPDKDRPPHYRQFRVDTTLPLIEMPKPQNNTLDWQQIQEKHFQKTGKRISVVKHRSTSKALPDKCRCRHCNAPARYLYLNNGKRGSQVSCKICKKTSSTNKPRRKSKAKYWCPHCGSALFLWKENGVYSAHKCQNNKCSFYLRNLVELTPEEQAMRKQGKTSQFKLRYLVKEYHFASEQLSPARIKDAPVDFNRIHNNLYVVSLCLTFTVSFGLSARMTAIALKRIFGISISHQTVINYINSSAHYLSDFVDNNCPKPDGICAADETYIKVEGETRYTWFIIEQKRRAICCYNLSDTRNVEPALALINCCYGLPESPKYDSGILVTDGLPSYDSAIVAYNTAANKASGNKNNILTKKTVIGLQNLNAESEEYRFYKQLVERLNRTYKYHTRPRAGFKNFDGAVALTTLFVAFYNFMRPHGSLKQQPPVTLNCLQKHTLYPNMWVELLLQAA